MGDSMSTIINATTTNGVVIQPDNSGSLVLQTNSGTTALTIDTSQNATFAGTLTATGKLASSSMPTGSVLQVVSASKSDTFSTSSTSFTDITGLNLSITPKFTTSKILVFMAVQVSTNGIDAPMVQIVRNSTAIGIGDARGSRTRNTSQGIFTSNSVSSLTGITLDSPSTTSATTYKLQTRIDTSTAYINTQSATGDGTYHGTNYSTIMVMEIAA
jgi:hypothetical protein